MRILKTRQLPISVLIITMTVISCKKFVEIPPPPDQLFTGNVFENDSTAIQAVNGIYSEMMNNATQFCNGSVTFYAGMAADEIYYYSPSIRDEFLTNEITLASHVTLETQFWSFCYKYIYAANAAIEGAEKANNLTQPVKDQVIGQSRFIRAFCYFYLVQLFGDVPLVISTDYRVNAVLPRTAKNLVSAQVITDLTIAQSLLTTTYFSAERVKPNKWAATALLARAYLYNQDWSKAEQQAGMVIGSGMYALEPNLNNVFLKASNEAIWQLRPVNPVYNTFEGNLILPGTSSSTPTYLFTSNLITAFEAGDNRRTNWVQTRTFASQTLYYPYKYKVFGSSAPWTEYYMVLRLAEQYLVRAEARAHLGNFSGSKTDIDMIRSRAGLPGTPANNELTLLTAIEKERRIEMMAEWGHRWFDLKRTGRATPVLGILKPLTWQDTDQLWPIPDAQRNLNPFLTQNPGY